MKNLISMLAIICLAMTFIQCNQDDDNDTTCICPEIFSPVCGDDGMQYSNECFANCAGVEFTPGFCAEEGTGLVLDLGDPALDGCGWVIELTINDVTGYYRPDTLSEAFKVDSMTVNVNYKQTMESSPCGMASQIPVIEVLGMSEL